MYTGIRAAICLKKQYVECNRQGNLKRMSVIMPVHLYLIKHFSLSHHFGGIFGEVAERVLCCDLHLYILHFFSGVGVCVCVSDFII